MNCLYTNKGCEFISNLSTVEFGYNIMKGTFFVSL